MYDGPFFIVCPVSSLGREVETKDDPLFYAIKNLETGHIKGWPAICAIAHRKAGVG